MEALIFTIVSALFIVWMTCFIHTFSSSEEREAQKRLRDSERRDVTPEEW